MKNWRKHIQIKRSNSQKDMRHMHRQIPMQPNLRIVIKALFHKIRTVKAVFSPLTRSIEFWIHNSPIEWFFRGTNIVKPKSANIRLRLFIKPANLLTYKDRSAIFTLTQPLFDSSANRLNSVHCIQSGWKRQKALKFEPMNLSEAMLQIIIEYMKTFSVD